MHCELDLLEQRIRRLESQNRRVKWLGLLMVVLAMATAAWGQKTGRAVMQAQTFELRDETGRLRAELSMLNGGPALRFFGEHEDGESLLAGDSFTIFKKGGEGDIRAAYGAQGLRIEDGNGKVFITVSGYEEDQGGKLRVNDYQSKVFTVVTAEDLAKLHPEKAR